MSKKMKEMKEQGLDPVVPLHKYLYGEPEAGNYRDQYLGETLTT